MTSLAFMFDDVPEPVWKTSIGNCVVVLAGGDLVARGGDPLGQLGVEQPELGVHARGGALDAAEPADDRQRDAFAGHREVRDGLAWSRRPTAPCGVSCTLIGLLRVIVGFALALTLALRCP